MKNERDKKKLARRAEKSKPKINLLLKKKISDLRRRLKKEPNEDKHHKEDKGKKAPTEETTEKNKREKKTKEKTTEENEQEKKTKKKTTEQNRQQQKTKKRRDSSIEKNDNK